MADTIHVAGLGGSLRASSRSRVALGHALAGAAAAGATTDLIDPRELALPLFDADDQDVGDAPSLRARLRDADALLLGTPMYHGSYSSVLKTAMDHAGFDEFESKTVGLLAVSGGSFPITALDHLRSVCRALDAWVLPYEAAIPNAGDHVANGTVDGAYADRVTRLGQLAVRYARIEPEPATFESGQNVGAE